MSDSNSGAVVFKRQYVHNLEAEIERLQQENASLKAVVDRLPKTADGITMLPGMRVCDEDGDGYVVYRVELHTDRMFVDVRRAETGDISPYYLLPSKLTMSLFYSTRAAAEAAKK